MSMHEEFAQPDRTTELLNQIAVTLGGEAVGQSPNPGEQSSTAAICNEQPSIRGEQVPPPTFDQVLESLSPGSSKDMMAVQRLVQERLPEILSRLPRLSELPSPAEAVRLGVTHGCEPFLLENPVTVGQMANFLCTEEGTTHEIGLQIFGNSYVFIPGDENEATIPYAWRYVEDHVSANIHTHPTHDAEYYHYPSSADLELARDTNAPHLVMSANGIILYPGGSEAGAIPSLREHGLTLPPMPAGIGIEGAHEIKVRNKDAYLNNVAKIQVIPWDALPPEATMHDAINYAIGLRQQLYDSGDLGTKQ